MEAFSLDDAARLLFVVWADRLDEGDAIVAYDALSPYDKAEWQRRARHHHSDVTMLVAENTSLNEALRPFANALAAHERRIAAHNLSPLPDDDFACITWPNGEQTIVPVAAFRAAKAAQLNGSPQARDAENT